MTKKIFSMIALAAGLFLAGTAFAQTATSSVPGSDPTAPVITFPISELGDCASKDACKVYCDVAAHHDACFAYAQEHHLMSSAQVSAAKAVLAKKGPGGCSSKDECKTYCSDSSHAAECVTFAQSHNLLATSTALLTKKIATSGGPGGCKSGDECKTYCSDVSHLAVCKQFAQENGGKQKEAAQKIDQLLQEKEGPGGCTSKDSCKAYCDTPTHGTECRQFALDNGLISQEQFEQGEKVASTTGPNGCRGDACKTYCSDNSHHDECLSYAVKAGIVTKDAADNAKKIEDILSTEGGPGGCKSIDECKAYCSDSTHREECDTFLTSHNISKPAQDDAAHMPAPGGSSESTMPSQPRPFSPQPTSGATSDSTKIVCHTMDECKLKCAGNTANCLYIPNTTTASQPPPPTTAPQTQPPTTSTTETKVICHTIDECKLLCGTNTANCLYVPLTTTTQPPPPDSTLPPPPPPQQPPTTSTTGTTNTSSTATKIICHTMDECKLLCGTNTANCSYIPLTTSTEPPPSGSTAPPPPPPPPASTTSTMGSAVITAFLQFIHLW